MQKDSYGSTKIFGEEDTGGGGQQAGVINTASVSSFSIKGVSILSFAFVMVWRDSGVSRLWAEIPVSLNSHVDFMP